MKDTFMSRPENHGQAVGLPLAMPQPIGPEQVKKFGEFLNKYRAGKAATDNRIISSENWWKLRNSQEERKTTEIGKDGGFTAVSAWLHNTVVSKHADAMEAYPEPNILPREASDKEEAKKLSDIIPFILERNGFEHTYSSAMWDKLKSGTGAYKVFWDQDKLNGLGDITVEQVNLLNIFWEPGVEDIQKSRFFFHCEMVEKELLEEQYPQLKGKLKDNGVFTAQYHNDDNVSNADKATVVDVFYHTYDTGKKTLQYCKYVGDQVLFASENDPEMRQRGFYDHGMFPYMLDPLFPVKGSPCGYGFVDVCRNPQTAIDLFGTAFAKNAMVGATPRYFSRVDGAVNEEEFLDLSKPIVHVNGNVGEDYLRRVEHTPLDGNYLTLRDQYIQELRETSGNTETSTGSTGSGVTAASAIAALQEASGKGSRDSTKSTYRAYRGIIELCIELVRQFYDLPRQFRILGQYGEEQFVTYDNRGIKPVAQGMAFGEDMGYRMAVFDVKVSAQKQNIYTKVSQNELALQFFKMGFLNPQMADQALMCLEMMDFDGKDMIMQKISKNGGLYQKLLGYMQIALSLAMKCAPEMVEQISQDVIATMQGGGSIPASSGNVSMLQTDSLGAMKPQEHGIVRNARARANNASQPDGGQVVEGNA